MNKKLNKKIKHIKTLVFDVDGTLTDGRLIFDKDGNELKSFFVRDGSRMTLALKSGLRVFFLSQRVSPSILKRAENRKIHGVLSKDDYADDISGFYNALGSTPEETLFIGDDVNDLPFMRTAGIKVAVFDATPEIKHIADIVTKSRGGCGAAAEIIELVMRVHGTWKQFLP